MADPEVRQLSLAYARAVAITEKLASELDQTVTDLVSFIEKRNGEAVQDGAVAPVPEPEPPTQPMEVPRARPRRKRV